MTIKRVITKDKCLDFYANCPNYYYKKYMGNNKENMDVDIVKANCSKTTLII